MSNIHPIHPPAKSPRQRDDDRLEQACAWVAKLDRGLSTTEEQQLRTWCEQEPANREEFLAVALQWDKMESLKRLSDLFPAEPVQQRSRLRPWAMAASVLLFSLVALLSVNFAGKEPVGQIASQASYQTGIGESSTIELPDHSKLVLNTNSFVVVRYSEQSRIIELQRGEITIDVAHDTARPLSVLAGGKVIQAVGTAFNVDLRKDYVELIVTEGKVLVAPEAIEETAQRTLQLTKRLPQNSLAITKGERVDLDPAGKKPEQVVKLDASTMAASLSWRSGNLIFRGEALPDVVNEISRYTNIQFELADDVQLQQIRVAGLFKTGDVNGLLDVFKNNFNIHAEKVAQDKIRLSFEG